MLYVVGCRQNKEGNVLFNDALNTFYFWLFGIRVDTTVHVTGIPVEEMLDSRFYVIY